MRRTAWLRAFLVGVPLITMLLVVQTSGAVFQSSASSATNSFQGDALQPPTGVTATHQCLLGLRSMRVTWTASPSAWATTYRVSRSVNSGAWTSVGTVSYGTNTWTDNSISGSTSYAYRVRTERTGWSWTSADAQSASVNTPGLCL